MISFDFLLLNQRRVVASCEATGRAPLPRTRTRATQSPCRFAPLHHTPLITHGTSVMNHCTMDTCCGNLSRWVARPNNKLYTPVGADSVLDLGGVLRSCDVQESNTDWQLLQSVGNQNAPNSTRISAVGPGSVVCFDPPPGDGPADFGGFGSDLDSGSDFDIDAEQMREHVAAYPGMQLQADLG